MTGPLKGAGLSSPVEAVTGSTPRTYEEIVDEWRLNLTSMVDGIINQCGNDDHERVHQAFIEYLIATGGPIFDALTVQVRMALARLISMEVLHRGPNREGLRCLVDGTLPLLALCAATVARVVGCREDSRSREGSEPAVTGNGGYL